MREYGKVHSSFWTDDTLSFLSNDARLLALYLLTGPHTNSVGCFRLPNGYISADLFEAEKPKQAPKRTERALLELEDSGFIHRDQKNGWTLIKNFLRYNPPENGNVGIRMAKDAAKVPKTVSFFDEFLSVLKTVEDRLPEGFMKGFGNGSGNGIANGIPTPEPEPEPEPEPSTCLPREREGFEHVSEIFEAAEIDLNRINNPRFYTQMNKQIALAEKWLNAGKTAEHICMTIRTIKERKNNSKINSLNYYDDAVMEARNDTSSSAKKRTACNSGAEAWLAASRSLALEREGNQREVVGSF